MTSVINNLFFQGVQKKIIPRPKIRKKSYLNQLEPILVDIFLTRGVNSDEELKRGLVDLPSPDLLLGMESMLDHLVEVLQKQARLCIVADFDADGATSCCVAMLGLKMLGATQVNYVVPNRFEYGYGLTPEIVELVQQQHADYILTVDNGISSHDGVKAAHNAGMLVLVTDHHLPGETLPDAAAIVNPNQPNDEFPSKIIAGVGVIFYVLMALRARLRKINWFKDQNIPEPNLAQLLDLVALGTVADVVKMDQVNRILVYQGLLRIRSGSARPGIQALIDVAKRSMATLDSADLGFALGPRLNAAGRLDDMSLGIQCLLSENPALARDMAQQLDDLNRDRKDIEAQMKKEAMVLLQKMHQLDEKHLAAGVCLYDKYWHQGVIGILASRIKDRLHRPVVVFAPGDNGEIKGSARSIPDVHIRDVLAEVAAAHPAVLKKFGGHAMAAGLTLQMHDYPVFTLAFDEVVARHLNQVDLEQKIYTDGQLQAQQMTVEFVERLKNITTWGHDFPEPMFDGCFEVIQARVVGQQHLKWVLRFPESDQLVDAIAFFVDHAENWLGTRQIKTVYKLDINEYRGNRSVQLMLQYFEKLA
jgi:single-stranded-DNA-specific exonuclease